MSVRMQRVPSMQAPSPTAKVVYKKLASMIASKHSQSYSQTVNWLRCRLSSPYSTPQLCASGGNGHQQTNQLSHNCLKLQSILPSVIAEWPD